jgi:hypothetical protein
MLREELRSSRADFCGKPAGVKHKITIKIKLTQSVSHTNTVTNRYFSAIYRLWRVGHSEHLKGGPSAMPTNLHQVIQVAECIAAAYVFWRGIAVITHNACCWILVKFGGAEYKEMED